MIDLENNPECMICLGEIKNNIWTCEECSHIFHKKCIHQWNKNCPNCQTNISFNDVIVINNSRHFNYSELLVNPDPRILCCFIIGIIIILIGTIVYLLIMWIIYPFYPFGNYTAYNNSFIHN